MQQTLGKIAFAKPQTANSLLALKKEGKVEESQTKPLLTTHNGLSTNTAAMWRPFNFFNAKEVGRGKKKVKSSAVPQKISWSQTPDLMTITITVIVILLCAYRSFINKYKIHI